MYLHMYVCVYTLHSIKVDSLNVGLAKSRSDLLIQSKIHEYVKKL